MQDMLCIFELRYNIKYTEKSGSVHSKFSTQDRQIYLRYLSVCDSDLLQKNRWYHLLPCYGHCENLLINILKQSEAIVTLNAVESPSKLFF